MGLLTDKINMILPDGLAEKNSQDLDKKERDKLRSIGFFSMEQDDFEPDYEVLSIRKQGITIYPAGTLIL